MDSQFKSTLVCETFSAILTLCEAEAAVLVAAACKRSPYDFLGVKSSWDIDPLAY